MTAEPIIFPVIAIPHVHDGDTLWVVRRWRVGDDGNGELWKQDYPGGVAVRLTDGKAGLATPELKQPRGLEARDDLVELTSHWALWPLELVWWGKFSFNRLLGDVRPPGSTHGLTATMRVMGWDAWKK